MLFRKVTERAAEVGSKTAGMAAERVNDLGKRANEQARKSYNIAMNHPKTTAAVVLGTGAAAALIWMMRRNGGFAETRRTRGNRAPAP